MLGISNFYVPKAEEHDHTGDSVVIPESEVDIEYINIGDGDFVVERDGGTTKVTSQVDIVAPNIPDHTHLNVDGHVVQRDALGGVHISNLVIEAEEPFTNTDGWLPGLNFAQATTLGEV